MKTKVTFIGYWPDYEAMAIDQADSALYDVVRFNPELELGRFFPPKKIPKPLRTRLEKKLIKRAFAKHSDGIFVVTDTRIPLEALDEYRGRVDAYVVMRNILFPETKTGKRVLALKEKRYSIWSFDRQDCDRYGFDYYDQYVVRIPGLKEEKIRYDLTFVGRDKGRAGVLESLAGKFSDAGLTSFFNIRSSDKNAVNKNLSYAEYIRILCSGKCIVDIVQKSQTGMTMRPLEALVYGRKLFTNNMAVKEEPFYHPDNIYAVSDFDLPDVRAFQSFLDCPLVEMPEALLSRYSVNGFLGKVLEKRTSGEIPHA